MDLKSFGQAIRELAEEKGVAEDKVVSTIELAIAAAYKKDYGKKGQMIRARFNPATGDLAFAQIKTVVDETMIKSEDEIAAEEAERADLIRPHPAPGEREIGDRPKGARRDPDEGEEILKSGDAEEPRKVRFNPERHIMLEEAKTVKAEALAGDELEFSLPAQSDFGRIASQTAKQVIIQRIREAEREATYSEYKSKEGEIVSGIIQRMEGRSVFIDLGRGVAILPPEEQLARERYTIGERMKAILLVVEKDARGSGMYLSRSHPRFLKKLFELEVPEIASGTVEIKTMAREAGSRSKIAVASNDPAIDPVGSMVGQRGVRVSTVINEIGGEKIDIIEWSDDPQHFIANALSPAKVLEVELAPSMREARVIVPDDQLSLAIGKGGQNVRLAAKLTGWKIDVRSNAALRSDADSRTAEPEETHASDGARAGKGQEHASNTGESERADLVRPRTASETAAAETPQEPTDKMPSDPTPAPAPKKRGRKPKKVTAAVTPAE